MQEVFHAFGIDWRLIVIEIFNFTVLAGALWYFLYDPILKIIRERKQVIEKGVVDAEEAARLRDEAQSVKGETIAEAETEAERIVEQARSHAKEQETELVHLAHQKAAQIVETAEERGKEIQDSARRDSEAEIAKLAVLAAEKVLTQK